MTSPNEWWKEEPFGHEVEYGTHESGGWYFDYDIEAIIEEVKRREKKTAKLIEYDHEGGDWVCGACDGSLSGYINDFKGFNYCPYCGAEFDKEL